MIELPKPPEQEARELMNGTAFQIADMLGKSIAALPVMVGLGRAPTEAACMAAATRITEMFGGAILSAIEGERAAAQAKGYVDAFYELATMLDIGARPQSPQVVWQTVMRPRIEALIAASPSTIKSDAGGGALP